MTQTKLRWGVLGTANINKRVFPSYARVQYAELAGIASRSLDKAKAAAQEDNIPNAYGSYEDLLDDGNIDVVYNPLPNHLHAEWTKKAADKGKHILCEKPLAPTAAEAQEIVDYCANKGVQLLDGFMWPHHPRTAKIRQSIDDGVIGTVSKVTSAFTFHMQPLDPDNIRLKPDMGGGSLLDVGCYPIYGIRWAYQEEPVRAFASARMQYGVDVDMHGILWFADGRMASFDCGFTSPLRMQTEIVGTQGRIYIPKMWLPDEEASFYVHGEDPSDVERITVPDQDQIACMIDHFSRCVIDGKPVTPEPEQAVRTLRVLDALAESARTGKIVDVAG